MANTVPFPELPPAAVVPYRVLPDKINPEYGKAPLLPPVKLCRLVKSVPFRLKANTVPAFAPPPSDAVPYRVLPDKIIPAFGLAPSQLATPTKQPQFAVKLCRFVKPVPSVFM